MRSRHTKHIMHLIFASTACCILNVSCFTVKYSTTGASIPPEAKTVSVQYFQNQATYIEPAFAQQLTDAFKDYLQSNTGLIIVNDIGDLDFEGTITGYDTKPTAIVSGDVASQNRFTITVRMKFSNYVNSDQNFETSFSRYEDYASSQDFENVKIQLSEKIQDLLIEDIFNRAFVNW
ncbi:MAG: LptE family protein [Bacteroidales bacterium]|nr:LptE family protein [Bacteroidales bacterium]